MKRIEEINWRNPVKNVHYVVVKELPMDLQYKFEEWLSGKRRPIIFNEGDNSLDCAYQFDYKEFLTHLEIHK